MLTNGGEASVVTSQYRSGVVLPSWPAGLDVGCRLPGFRPELLEPNFRGPFVEPRGGCVVVAAAVGLGVERRSAKDIAVNAGWQAFDRVPL